LPASPSDASAPRRAAPSRTAPTPQVRCLNEDAEGSCRNVFRPWEARTQPVAQPLRSDPDDEELLLTVP
jgi:hypothetical protein